MESSKTWFTFPDSFIELAENSNLIIPIGELILDMALKFKSTTQKLKKNC